MKRILQVLIDEGVVQKTEEQIDRRRMKVTYQRIPHVMDFSEAAIQARRTSPPDQKVYEVRSGHFVDRDGTQLVVPIRDVGALPPLDAALQPNARVWWDTRPRSESSAGKDLGANRSDSTPATQSGAGALTPPMSGPDTFADTQGPSPTT